ncbi:MAG: hypothetical protein K0R38_5018 [Polyangiaceae bacterium]|jgi:hypothetical protein|nr:hypothetical protein [Polyangiaceae bacterium]
MISRFLFNESLWTELAERIPKARNVRAAIAYLGSGAGALLPLKKGDHLLVDMSLRSVRAGSTDPKEVRKLLRRGVQVFTRNSLHAKFVVVGSVLIAGSANMSQHARGRLDEAAVLTDDTAAVKRALATFADLCTEPVRGDYLARCLSEYRPPRLEGGGQPHRKVKRTAKAWIAGGLRYIPLPEAEEEKAERVRKRAEKLLTFERAEVDDVHFDRRLRLLADIRTGDWAVVCVKKARGFDVYPPARVLGQESYARGRGKRRYFLLLETPTHARPVPWTRVRAAVASSIPELRGARPRTLALREDAKADALLRLWDARGVLRKPRKRARA